MGIQKEYSIPDEFSFLERFVGLEVVAIDSHSGEPKREYVKLASIDEDRVTFLSAEAHKRATYIFRLEWLEIEPKAANVFELRLKENPDYRIVLY